MENQLSGTVLLVDDDSDFRTMMRAVIKSLGLELVGEGTDGEEGVALYGELRPDLVLLDINMPVKNGEQALKEIIKAFPDAFVLMLTSIREVDSIETCFVNGAADYIPKDSGMTKMKETIRDAWGKFHG